MADSSLFVPKHFSVCFVYFLQQTESEEGDIINPIKHLIYDASDMCALLHGSESELGKRFFFWYLLKNENCLGIREVSACNRRALLPQTSPSGVTPSSS